MKFAPSYICLNIFLLLFQCFSILGQDFQINCEEAPSPVFRHMCQQMQRLHIRRKTNEHPDIPPPKCDTANTHTCAKPGTPIWEEIVGVDQASLLDQNTIENAETLQECQDFKCLCRSFYVVDCFKSSRNANEKVRCMQREYDIMYPDTQSCRLPNGNVLKKAYRKEYRMLSAEERTSFHNALNRVKQDKIYDYFHALHYHYSYGGGAHSGPAFVLWHREFIKRFEIALREVDPDVSLPYWDTTMDYLLPEPKDSILWTADLLGSVDNEGKLASGPFKDWITLEVIDKINNTDKEIYLKSVPLTKKGGKKITRKFEFYENIIIQEINVTTIINNRNMLYIFGDDVTPNSTCSIRWTQGGRDGFDAFQTLESIHNGVHMYIGGQTGDMGELQTAVGDPVFFLLHSFIDLIWELWRQTQQSPEERENSFREPDENCHFNDHFIDSNMRPFKYQMEYITNRDGLSNKVFEWMCKWAHRYLWINFVGNDICRPDTCGRTFAD